MNSYIRRLLTRGVKTPTGTVRRPRAVLGVHPLEDRITPNVYTVSSTADAGIGTLRQAILDSLANAGADDIVFDSSFATAKTITLDAALPAINAGGDISITGPGASLLTVRRNPTAATQFGILNSTVGNTLLSGFTISGGNATSDGGGLFVSGTARLDGMAITGNTTTTNGGGIRVSSGGFLDIRNSTVSGNSSGGSGGGGIYFVSGGSLVMENTTVSGNTSTGTVGGGGLYFFGTASASPPTGFTASTLTVRNSIFSGNTATAAGGGIVLPSFTGTLVVQNSTISGNTAATSGGGIAGTSGSGSITAVNTTIVGNRANGTGTAGGGGIGRTSTTAGTITLQNTVVAGNTNTPGPDVLASSATTTTANFSAIGNATGFTLTSSANNISSGTALLLGAAGNNGGSGPTVAPQPGSPLINAGSAGFVPSGTPNDVRGIGFVRVNGTVDIGALEVQPVAPTALTATAANITAPGGTTHTFTVTFADDAALNVATIVGNNAAIRVTGPNGYSVLATYQSIDVGTNGTPRTATYTIPAAGGTWDGADNGVYTISLVGNQVADATAVFAAAAPVATFSVQLPATFVVTNTNDAGAGSLRQALINANTNAGAVDTVTFDASFNAARTIALTGGQLFITDSVNIVGPGSGLLTVSGSATASASNRVFNVGGTGVLTVNMTGLTITGGNLSGANNGAGLLNTDEIINLTDVVITANTTAGEGGGISTTTGVITLTNSTVSNNTLTASGNDGGGINIQGAGTIVLQSSTVSGNTATDDGGGFYFNSGGVLTIDNSTISGNTGGTTGEGGGIYLFGAVTATIRNSTISGNTGGTGGGIGIKSAATIVNIIGSTIVGNNATAASTGGGIARTVAATGTGVTSLTNTVVAGNTNGGTTPLDISVAGNAVTADFSLIGVASGLTISGGNNKTGTTAAPLDPLLGPLADNGGRTKTHHPLAGSPVLDAGSNALIPTGTTADQRGAPLVRVFNSTVDIGAVELQPPTVTVDQAAGQADPTNSGPIKFTVVFATPVSGFDATDIKFTGSTQVGSLSATVVQVNSTTYTVSVTGMTLLGDVVASIDAGAANLGGVGNLASTSTDNVVRFDNESPQVAVNQAAGQPDPTNGAINFTVLFTEPINPATFTPADLSFAGSTAGGTLSGAITAVSGAEYTVTVTGMTSSGLVRLSLPASKVADLAGNLNLASTSTDNTVSFDNVAPTVTINQAATQADPTNAGPILFTVVFNEAADPASFAGTDISFAGSTVGGTLSAAIIPVNATTFTVSVTGMTGNGTVVVGLPAGSVKDLAGNDNAAAATSTDNSVTFDTAAPTVTINQAATQADPTNGPIQFTVVFSEPVNKATFTGPDISFAGSTAGGPLSASVAAVGSDSKTFTVTVTGMTSSGNVVATLPANRVTDLAGNPNTAATFADNVVAFDNVAPTVTINQAAGQPDPASAEPYHFSVVFSEDVYNFDAADIIVGGTAGATKVEVFPVGASKSLYDVYLSQTTQAGTVIASVRAGAATDKAGNVNSASTSTDNSIFGDTAPPVVAVNQAAGQADPTSTPPVRFTVTFNEDVTGFDETDISFAGSTAGGTLAAALTMVTTRQYTVTVTGMTSDGFVVVSVPAGAVQDLFGNVSKDSVSTDNSVRFDTTPPTATIDQAGTQADPTNVAAIEFTVVFGEDVTGFDNPLTDVVLSGTAGGTLVATITPVSGSTYTVTVTGMTSSGTVVATVPAGAAIDLVGLPSAAAVPGDNTVVFDIAAPGTTIAPVPAFINSADVPITFTGTDNFTAAAGLTFEYSLDGGAFAPATSPLNLTGLADGPHTVAVRATDAAGNTDATPATVTVTVDTAAPGLTLTSASPDPTKDNPIRVTATFTEDVFSFDLADLVLTNATASNLQVLSPSQYTFDLTPLADGPVAVSVLAGAAPDPAGNANAGATLSRTADISAPTVTLTSTSPDPTRVSPIHVTATFSELVTSFTQADLFLTNATVANFQAISGTTYEFDLIPTGQGVVSAAVPAGAAPDPAGNANAAGSIGRVYDTAGPAVAINQAATQADPTNATTVFFTVVFSEPVTGFTGADVVVGGTSGATTATVTGSGTTYTVAVSGIKQFGSVTASVAAGAATDAAGNLSAGSTSTDNTILADPVAPLATIAQAAGQRDPTTVGPVTFTVVFTKPVTGFTPADLDLGKSTAGGTLTAALSGSGTTYTVTVDGMTTPGTVVLSFASGAAVDSAGNVSRAPTGDGTVTYAGQIFAVGASDGGAPRVDVFNGTGRVLYSFFAFDPSFRGGVHVATGDVTGDGIPDVVVGAGVGGAPHVKVFDGRTGLLVSSFFAYSDEARGGVSVAVADVTGDGIPDIVTGAGVGGAPHVKVINGFTLATVQSFFAFDGLSRGGVSVAAGDVTGDGLADIIAGDGATGEIQVFDGQTLASVRRIAPFFSPVTSALPLGVNLAVGDVTGDGVADVLVGGGEGGAPQVQVYDGKTGVLSFKNAIFAFDPTSRRGVSLAVRDMNGDGVGEILAGDGQTGQVRLFDGDTLAALQTLEPFGKAYVGGVFVG